MSPSPVTIEPVRRLTVTREPAGRSCAFGANCNCVFNRIQPTVTDTTSLGALDAEVTTWTDLGYRVTEQSADTVLLERRRGIPFCFNLSLCVVTAGLWLVYWVPAIRHPKFDTRRVTSAADGTVSVERSIRRS